MITSVHEAFTVLFERVGHIVDIHKKQKKRAPRTEDMLVSVYDQSTDREYGVVKIDVSSNKKNIVIQICTETVEVVA